MKRILFASVLSIIVLCSAALAPGKTKERDIIGKWKLHLDISKAVDEETKDDDDFGAAFARGIISMVDDLVDEIDITFHFKKNHTLIVTQNSNFDDDDEDSVEEYEWKIDKNGHVITKPINKRKFSYKDNDGWILKDGKLIPVDNDKDTKGVVWMEKIK